MHVPQSVTKKTLLERGLPFAVVTGKNIDVTATLTARIGGRTVTLARVHQAIDGPGREKIRLRPTGSRRRLVRGRRSFRAKVTILATDNSGGRRTIERAVRVSVPKAR